MTPVNAELLAGRGIVTVSGPDAEAFLQGLLTNDMGALQAKGSMFAGLLSPQGKLLFDFLISPFEVGFALDVALALAPALAQRLALYKLRAKVDIADQSQALRVVVGGPGALDPRLAALGTRSIGTAAAALPNAADYDARRIALGVPEGGKDHEFGTLFPHEAMFDQLRGVSFTKGCYVGQEIVARMQHRGTARSRFLLATGAAPLPPLGTNITAGAVTLGSMGSSAGGRGLALVRLDRLAEAYAARTPVTAGGVPLTLAKPAYAAFDVPGPAAP